MIKKRATKGAEAIALITEIYATLLTKLPSSDSFYVERPDEGSTLEATP
jgi:hypothetical protein